MDDAKADIMMYFLLAGGGKVYGESFLQIDPKDDFMTGFTAASAASDYSSFFEVSQFGFQLRVNASESGGGSIKGSTKGQQPATAGSHGGAQKKPDQYERWRSALPEDLKKMKYQIDFGTFSFKRSIDAASPIFFQNCANQITFKEAVLVKRVQTGLGDEKIGAGFLRIEFTDVLITKVSWDDGDIVKEDCSFKCKDMVVKYKRQNQDGTMSNEISQARWNQELNGQPPDAGTTGTP